MSWTDAAFVRRLQVPSAGRTRREPGVRGDAARDSWSAVSLVRPEEQSDARDPADQIEGAVRDDPQPNTPRAPDGDDERGECNQKRREEPRLPQLIDREKHQVDRRYPPTESSQPRQQVAAELQLFHHRRENPIQDEQEPHGDE
jgi:hypothetical protein